MKNDIKKYLTLGAVLAGSAFMVSCDDGDTIVLDDQNDNDGEVETFSPLNAIVDDTLVLDVFQNAVNPVTNAVIITPADSLRFTFLNPNTIVEDFTLINGIPGPLISPLNVGFPVVGLDTTSVENTLSFTSITGGFATITNFVATASDSDFSDTNITGTYTADLLQVVTIGSVNEINAPATDLNTPAGVPSGIITNLDDDFNISNFLVQARNELVGQVGNSAVAFGAEGAVGADSASTPTVVSLTYNLIPAAAGPVFFTSSGTDFFIITKDVTGATRYFVVDKDAAVNNNTIQQIDVSSNATFDATGNDFFELIYNPANQSTPISGNFEYGSN